MVNCQNILNCFCLGCRKKEDKKQQEIELTETQPLDTTEGSQSESVKVNQSTDQLIEAIAIEVNQTEVSTEEGIKEITKSSEPKNSELLVEESNGIAKVENRVNAQTWLESQAEYNTKQKRTDTTKLLITDQLTGTLDLSDFTKLKKIFIAQSVDTSQFAITNQSDKVEIITNSWIDIHEGFGKEYYGKICQQIWEEEGFTAQDAQVLIKVGFEPDDLRHIQYWKNLNFTPDQAQKWINIGLDRYREYELAYYCQTKQLTPAEVKDNLDHYKDELKQKREQELKSTQAYLDFFYPLTNHSKIKVLNIRNKNLTSDLNLTGFDNLIQLDCSDNKLTNLNFLNTLPAPEKLTKLGLFNNNITSDLTPLSKLVNLQELNLRYNRSLATSLAPLQHCSQLEKLDIKDTNLTPDLQYLPLSLSEIVCDGKTRAELNLYGNNLMVWQAAHPQLMKEVGQEVVIDNNDYTKSELKTITTTPKEFAKYLNQTTEPVTNHRNFWGILSIPFKVFDNHNLDYSQFALRDSRPLPWENKKLEKATTLPLRLYNLSTKQVEVTKDRTDIPYLALSYVWGTDWENQRQKYGQDYETDLTQLGRKALNKVIAAKKLIPINHIWIDNFCINQGDKEEKGQEVAKQQQYYNNASATLIAIDNSVGEAEWESETKLAWRIIKQIIISPWFKRSWTFQEGLLSKQTLFLFDDKIVDGRSLANYWGGVQEKGDLFYLKTTPTIFITPLGWSYGAQKNQTVQLGLSQALHAVSHRGQTVPLDGLYSILGLLPYGKDVKTNYKSKVCPHSEKEQKDINICQHTKEEKDWPTYTQEELNTELKKIMELAVANGYSYEPFSWVGTRQVKPELWKFPTLKADGTSEITGFVEFQPDSNKFSATGWEFVGYKELVTRDNKETGSKVGDIIIRPHYKQIKSTNKLEIIFPVANKANRPIVFEEDRGYDYNNKLFLDMVNKEVITGKKLITQYQQQLPLIQQQNQPFSLVYGRKGDNVTVNNSLVWQSQGQYYILDNKQLQAIPATDIWKNIHPAFTDPALIKKWTNKHWTYGLVQEWANYLEDKFNPQDYDFATWVRDIKKINWWKVKEQESKLRTEFQTYQTEQQVAQMEISPK